MLLASLIVAALHLLLLRSSLRAALGRKTIGEELLALGTLQFLCCWAVRAADGPAVHIPMARIKNIFFI
jgi:hypothetical protein